MWSDIFLHKDYFLGFFLVIEYFYIVLLKLLIKLKIWVFLHHCHTYMSLKIWRGHPCQNSAARLLMKPWSRSHITPGLDWLLVTFRVSLSELTCPLISGRSLRSSEQRLLTSFWKLNCDQAFAVVALWHPNSLLETLRELESVYIFKKQLISLWPILCF